MVDLISALSVVKTRPEMEAFLAALLSTAELRKLQTRLELFQRLRTGQSHRLMSRELGVGVATVARAVAAAQRHAEIIQTVLNRAAQDSGSDGNK